MAESFFPELIHHEDFQTREEAQQAIFEPIEVFYNRQRQHSTNGYLAPFNYEQELGLASPRKKVSGKALPYQSYLSTRSERAGKIVYPRTAS